MDSPALPLPPFCVRKHTRLPCIQPAEGNITASTNTHAGNPSTTSTQIPTKLFLFNIKFLVYLEVASLLCHGKT